MNIQDTRYRIEKYLTEQLPRYLDMLHEMVVINSFTLNVAGVNQLGTLTAARFESLGFTTVRVPPANSQYGDHVVMTRTGQSGRKIGLVSHLDTVYTPAEETQNEFFWHPVGDRIYGPGTVDIKGGTVMIYMVLEALRKFAPDVFDDITWVVLLDAAEETDITQFRAVCANYLAGDTLACLVFEASHSHKQKQSTVVVARKGMAIFRVEVEGRSAHPGTAFETGVNAVVHLAELVSHMASLTDPARGITCNVGTIAGGTTINRVPHFATAGVELRAFSQPIFEAGVEQMLALAGPVGWTGNGRGDKSGQSLIKLLRKVSPWPRNEASDSLLAIWQATGQQIGWTVVPEERGGLSDGNVTWQSIPTIDGLGPLGANAHCSERRDDGSKDQEYVLSSSFVPLALLNTLAILRLINGQ
jgi:glutamate carboxypeptidase